MYVFMCTLTLLPAGTSVRCTIRVSDRYAKTGTLYDAAGPTAGETPLRTSNEILKKHALTLQVPCDDMIHIA